MGSFGAVFKVLLRNEARSSSAAASLGTDGSTAGASSGTKLAMKVVFNYGLSSSKAETNDTQKEFDILTRLPTHPNMIRLLFEFVSTPPMWMVEQLPDPSLVCVAEDSEDEGENGPVALVPRKAQLVCTELLRMTLGDKLERMGGTVGDDVLVPWSRDIAEGVLHLLRHGVVHRDLKLDNVMWDRAGGPEGIGRVVLIDFGCSLRVDVDATAGAVASAAAADPSASSGTAAAGGGGRTARSDDDVVASIEAAACRALDMMRFSFLNSGGDGIGGNQQHLAPEVLDAWYRATAGERTCIVPYGKQASWALGVLLFEMASGGQHPVGEGYPGEFLDGTRVVSGGVGAAVGSMDMLGRVSEVLRGRPSWYREVVVGLLRVDAESRMMVGEAARWLRGGGAGSGTAGVGALLSVHAASLESIDARMSRVAPGFLSSSSPASASEAISTLQSVLDGQDDLYWQGIARVVWYMRVQSGASSQDDLAPDARTEMSRLGDAMVTRFTSDALALGDLVRMMSHRDGNDAEIAACSIMQCCF